MEEDNQVEYKTDISKYESITKIEITIEPDACVIKSEPEVKEEASSDNDLDDVTDSNSNNNKISEAGSLLDNKHITELPLTITKWEHSGPHTHLLPACSQTLGNIPSKKYSIARHKKVHQTSLVNKVNKNVTKHMNNAKTDSIHLISKHYNTKNHNSKESTKGIVLNKSQTIKKEIDCSESENQNNDSSDIYITTVKVEVLETEHKALTSRIAKNKDDSTDKLTLVIPNDCNSELSRCEYILKDENSLSYNGNKYDKDELKQINKSSHTKIYTERPYFCKLCEYKSAHKSNLNTHMRIHSDDKPFACNLCHYKSRVKSALNTHMRTHTGDKPFVCKHCQHKFRHKNALTRHIRTHIDVKPYVCELCDGKFIQKDQLVYHMKRHTIEKQHFSCKLCSYTSEHKSNLVTHMRIHTGEKPYACIHCGYKSGDKSTLLSHLKTHTGEKSYGCDLCESKFARKNDLIMHMRTHTGEKPYSCGRCEKKFARKTHLTMHTRTHTGEKPYGCKVCDSKFAQKVNLIIHMRTHTGERPYPCEHCDSRFKTKSSYNTHLKTHN